MSSDSAVVDASHLARQHQEVSRIRRASLIANFKEQSYKTAAYMRQLLILKIQGMFYVKERTKRLAIMMVCKGGNGDNILACLKAISKRNSLKNCQSEQ